MSYKISVTVVAVLAATAGVLGPAEAQVVQRGSFDVGIGGGAMLHPNHTGLVSSSPFVNMRGRIFVTDNIGLGFSLDYSRTSTDDDIFPLAQFRFLQSDSTLFVALRQPVAIFHYQFVATLGAPLGNNVYPYVSGGIGGYTLYLDPQQNDGPERQSDLAFSFGGSIKLRVSGSSAFEIGVRDVIYTDYDRDKLDPTPDRTCRESTERQFSGSVCPNERFLFLDPRFSDPNWSEAKSTVHNIVLSASFSFVPRL